jgi:hypothetical protein
VRLLPVALLILQEHGTDNPTSETAWIDLIEWGILSAWEVARTSSNSEIPNAVAQVWVSFYLAELERYYGEHCEKLAVRFSLDKPLSGSFVDAIAAAVVAHWHLGRLGILGVSYRECFPARTPEEREKRAEALATVSNWMIGMLNGNPSSVRPLIDLHHIELFLTWGTLMQVGRIDDAFNWLTMLANRGRVAELPFIEGHNSVELVFEFVAKGEKPHEFCDKSSVYLMCLQELICSLPSDRRDQLLSNVYRRLVLARTDDGSHIDGCEPIDLMLWIPPEDWGDRVLKRSLADEGECATIRFGKFGEDPPTAGEDIFAEIVALVAETRTKRVFKYPKGIPFSVIVLACLKHRSPLPPEIWRRSIFQKEEPEDSVSDGTNDAESADGGIEGR